MPRFRFAFLASAAVLFPAILLGQDSVGTGDLPQWLFDDSIFVERPSWISATVAKDIVVVSFRHGTNAARRAAIIRGVHGTIVLNDRSYGSDGYYFVRVASHPDACGVKQALDVLDRVPQVETATTHMPFVGSVDRLMPMPATHKGSNRPCPLGTGLLK